MVLDLPMLWIHSCRCCGMGANFSGGAEPKGSRNTVNSESCLLLGGSCPGSDLYHCTAPPYLSYFLFLRFSRFDVPPPPVSTLRLDFLLDASTTTAYQSDRTSTPQGLLLRWP